MSLVHDKSTSIFSSVTNTSPYVSGIGSNLSSYHLSGMQTIRNTTRSCSKTDCTLSQSDYSDLSVFSLSPLQKYNHLGHKNQAMESFNVYSRMSDSRHPSHLNDTAGLTLGTSFPLMNTNNVTYKETSTKKNYHSAPLQYRRNFSHPFSAVLTKGKQTFELSSNFAVQGFEIISRYVYKIVCMICI